MAEAESTADLAQAVVNLTNANANLVRINGYLQQRLSAVEGDVNRIARHVTPVGETNLDMGRPGA